MRPATWIALAIWDRANVGISARLAAAAFARVEPDTYALAVPGPTLLELQRGFIGLRTVGFGLRLDFGLRSGLRRRWQTLSAEIISLLRLECLGSRSQRGI